ncbi:hypothetical protein RI129_008935 [Pyrocoelia pectoralis]|uniref:Zinc carboxypeptidase A 1 n=1 Tax=Pyrocoelia pectoralis TaxID=417401 RepID=A0AAN7VCD3_9COLE
MNIVALVLLSIIGFCIGLTPLLYNGYKVYRVIPKTFGQLVALRNLESEGLYDFWSEVRSLHEGVDLMVPPNLMKNFKIYLENFNLDAQIFIEDVQKSIDKERSNHRAFSPRHNLKSYQTLDEMNNWLQSLPALYPGIVETVVGGISYESRKILGVHVSYKSGNKAVFLEGGIHAREWIAPATVTFILNELLTSSDPSIRSVAQSRDWYIFPCVNPDGYEYTKIDRLWRKTRSRNGKCFGADANRNWGYKWMQGGSNSNSCSNNFAGSAPFSEIENLSLSQFIDSISANLEVYLSFHSYSQLLLIPFGHQGLEVPKNNEELHYVGNKAINALAKRYGTKYEVGNFADTLYIASGLSTDWVAAKYKVRLVYTFELRDTGKDGFLLPEEQIIPTGQETLDAVVSMIKQINNTCV